MRIGRVSKLGDVRNIADFRELARRKLPYPVFHYIDGGGDDESTKARNTSAFDDADLVPNVLVDVETVDPSVTVLGRKSALPLMLSPTALQRLFHWQGERATAAAAEKFGLWFGISSLASVGVAEIGARFAGPKMLQYYYHKDRGLNAALLEMARAAKFDAVALTVDTIVGGNRERCLRTGFTSPPRITAASAWSYASKPRWALDYLLREKFSLPNLEAHIATGSDVSASVANYFSQFLDQTMDWKAAEKLRDDWGGKFALKGVMSVADARRAADMGFDAIFVSNHGGRQLDGARAPFDQLAEIVDAVGGRIEVILDGGVRRGTHVLKALSLGATAVSGGRLYLYALAAAGQAGVERALQIMQDEIVRDMKLMGVTRIDQLGRDNLRFREGSR
jgi:L-lactate dehydrogenase (cytochrome)